MTAARVGKPEIAIDALLMDVQKNTYLNNGHNYQDKRLTIYLPGNGGLLTATAMMAAGWDGAPEIHAPGFPQDGSWKVKYEGLSPMP
jgi:protein-glucosylgalactosylhydroxylysine glucosidase